VQRRRGGRRIMLNIFICTQLLAGFCLAFLPEIAPQQTPKPILRVYAFLGTDCPISQDYIGVLNEMNLRYKNKVTFLGLIPGDVSIDDIQKFKEEYQVQFDIESDNKMALVQSYDVHTTPEVVLIDNKEFVKYQGAIDNWFYALGKHRSTATEHYLKDAVEGLLSGNDVKVQRTQAIGCIINRSHGHKHITRIQHGR